MKATISLVTFLFTISFSEQAALPQSPDEIAEASMKLIRDQFDSIDQDGDGHLSLEEFTEWRVRDIATDLNKPKSVMTEPQKFVTPEEPIVSQQPAQQASGQNWIGDETPQVNQPVPEATVQNWIGEEPRPNGSGQGFNGNDKETFQEFLLDARK